MKKLVIICIILSSFSLVGCDQVIDTDRSSDSSSSGQIIGTVK